MFLSDGNFYARGAEGQGCTGQADPTPCDVRTKMLEEHIEHLGNESSRCGASIWAGKSRSWAERPLVQSISHTHRSPAP